MKTGIYKFSAFLLALILGFGLLGLSVEEILPKRAWGASSPVQIRQGDIIYNGSYPQKDLGIFKPEAGKSGTDWVAQPLLTHYGDTSPGSTHYYSIDPIPWKVLSNTNGELFLLSVNILDCQPFLVGHISNETSPGVGWKDSSLRSWLNGYDASYNKGNSTGVDFSRNNFIDQAFVASEKATISKSNITTNFEETPYGSEPSTTDKIFCLSFLEITDSALGFSSNASVNDETRVARNSGFAAARGSGRGMAYKGIGPSPYWLRTRSSLSSVDASAINDSGRYTGYPKAEAKGDHRGVRPAIKLDSNSSSLLFDSIAGQGGTFRAYAKQNVKLDANGGKVGKSKTGLVSIYYDRTTPKFAVAKKTGYSFKGWYSSKKNGYLVFDKNGVPKASISGFTDSSSKWIAGDGTTLYAQWKKIPPKKQTKIAKVIKCSILKVHKKASFKSKVIKWIKKGKKVSVIKKIGKNFYKIRISGKIGYVGKKYISSK